MIRADFTVVLTNGQRYAANHLTISMSPRYVRPDGSLHRELPGEWIGSGSDLSFICSGRLKVVGAEEVETIEFRRAGAGYCGECDGPIVNLIGAGIFANPWLGSRQLVAEADEPRET